MLKPEPMKCLVLGCGIGSTYFYPVKWSVSATQGIEATEWIALCSGHHSMHAMTLAKREARALMEWALDYYGRPT